MSDADPVVSRAAISRGVILKSFALSDVLGKRTTVEVRAIYADLGAKLRDGVLKAPVDATYPIDEIKAALAHAQRGGRNGKVLVLPNGPL
jgi:mitochondrial enoyl-[acyl-carrier protein] reductase / trans-2-enoyl-CoA reductase